MPPKVYSPVSSVDSSFASSLQMTEGSTPTQGSKPKLQHQTSIETEFNRSHSWQLKAEAYGLGARDREPSLVMSEAEAGLWNLVGSAGIAAECLMAPDTIIGCCSAITCTLFYWYVGQSAHTNMSWDVASMGVIFPITQAIGMGFSRRDDALSEFGNLLGHIRTLWGAFHCWEIEEGKGPWKRMVEYLGDDGSYDGPSAGEPCRVAFDARGDQLCVCGNARI